MSAFPWLADRRIAACVALALCFAAAGVLWVLGRSADTSVSNSAPTPTPAADTPIIFMGLRDRTSDPFFLSGGHYRGMWSAWGETPVDPPCTHSIELVALDSANPSPIIDLANLVHVPSTGATAAIDLVDLQPGDYYFEVSSACGWQVELNAEE